MRILTFLLHMLPPAILAVACTKTPADIILTEKRHGEKSAVRIDFGAKTSMPQMKSCLMFALDEDGKVIQKDSSLCRAAISGEYATWVMSAGNYRIWCVICGEASSDKRLWKCGTLEEIQDVAFAMGEQKPGYAPCLLTINGRDDIVCLGSGETQTVSLSGKPLMSKISLKNLVNKTSWNTAPAYGPVSVKCLEAVLLNVPDSATLDSGRCFALRNSTSSKTLDLTTECVHTAGSMTDILPDGSNEENLSLYCFPNENYNDDLVLAVSVCVGGINSFWYNIPIGKVRPGYEYTISNLVVMKEGAPTPFVLTPTEEFCSKVEVSGWEMRAEGGLAGESADEESTDGEVIFYLSHTHVFREAPPAAWTCELEDIYGSAYVRAEDAGKVCAIGAGKHWILSPLADGHTMLSVSNGLSMVQVPVCVGASIRYHWEDASGATWSPDKTLHRHQICRLALDDWYGDLTVDIGGSMFSWFEGQTGGKFVLTDPELNNSVGLRDFFEQRTAAFPYQTADWDFLDCEWEYSGEEQTVKFDRDYCAVMTFPFDLSESEFRPQIYIEDPRNSCKYYAISISDEIQGNRYIVRAKTLSWTGGDHLGISVYCRYGGQEKKIMTINKCIDFL